MYTTRQCRKENKSDREFIKKNENVKREKKSVNQKRENAMARRKGTKTRTTVEKIIHRKLR